MYMYIHILIYSLYHIFEYPCPSRIGQAHTCFKIVFNADDGACCFRVLMFAVDDFMNTIMCGSRYVCGSGACCSFDIIAAE